MNPDTGQLAAMEGLLNEMNEDTSQVKTFNSMKEAKEAGFAEELSVEEFKKVLPLSKEKRIEFIKKRKKKNKAQRKARRVNRKNR